MKNRYAACLALLVLVALAAPAAAQDAQTPAAICETAVAGVTEPANRDFTNAEQVLKPDVDYRAIFCTDAGAVYIDLLEQEAPVTVNNFIFLAEQGYYNNTTFHRVIQNFMVQGGDPTATGSGGPGYQFEDEFLPSLNFDAPGLLAMANAGPGTNGSQFFITTVPTPHLNQLHTIFGRVIKGQSNVEAVELRDPQTATTPGTALQTVVIIEDPSLVSLETTGVTAAVTVDEVKAAMDSISGIITPEVSEIIEAVTSSQTTQEVIEAAPEAAQEALEAYFAAHNHEFRVSGSVNNKTCDLNTVQFISVSYTMDAFATVDDASAALADEDAQTQISAGLGFGEPKTSEVLPHPYAVQTTNACDQDAIQARASWQRGRFVVTAEVLIPASDPTVVDILDRILLEFVGLNVFEPLLTEVLYRDIR